MGLFDSSRALLAIQTSLAVHTCKHFGPRRVSIPALLRSLCRLSARAQRTSFVMSTPKAYHFMFGPDYIAGCPSCSAIADGFNGIAVHLANHGTAATSPPKRLTRNVWGDLSHGRKSNSS